MSESMVRKFSPATNFAVVAALAFIALLGGAFATPIFGIWIAIPIGIGWSCMSFFLSHYLNEIVPEERRATVLSFRGLAFNLGYGGIGLAFAALSKWLAQRPNAPPSSEAVFGQALWWLPGYFLVTLVILGITVSKISRRRPVPV
jgi:MFS family permease